MKVRPGGPDDAAELAGLFHRSVEELGPRDYAPEQVAAWKRAGPDADRMRSLLQDGRQVFVAVASDGRLVGYIDLEDDGHIDQLYCLPEGAGRGVADQLYQSVESIATRRGIGHLHVEASEAARRFFARMGFVLDRRRDFELGSVAIHNFAMSKTLSLSADSGELPDGPEVPLLGGDVTEGLVRVGDTIRRPHLPVSDFVASVLEHLERVHFSGAPRYLGIDKRGRQALSFVAGDVASRPWPEWVADSATIATVARLLRRFDDAMQSMPITKAADSAIWPDPIGAPPSIAGPAQFIGHRDVTPENVVFRNDRAVALIDFDLAGPTTRVQEVVNLLQWWAPLMPVEDRQVVLRDVDVFARAALLVDEYGLDADDRRQLVPVAINSADRTWFTMRDRAQQLGGGWQRMWDDGVGEQIRRRQLWLRDNAAPIHTAVSN